MDTICLTIPAQQRWVLVARMALTGFASQCGADLDTLEDIRTLTDEACDCLQHQKRPISAITIAARQEGPAARITFEAAPAGGASCQGESHDPEIAKGILGTLASEVSIGLDGGCPRSIELVVRLAPL